MLSAVSDCANHTSPALPGTKSAAPGLCFLTRRLQKRQRLAALNIAQLTVLVSLNAAIYACSCTGTQRPSAWHIHR